MSNNKLITLDKAKMEVKKLNEYIEMIENYHVKNTDDWIIYNYSLTNSIKQIVEKAELEGTTYNNLPLDRNHVVGVINGKVNSELHRILRLGYRQRIKPNKRKV